MPLESFFKNENINVKNLAIGEPEKVAELPFNPEKEITAEDWENMKELLELNRKNNRWSNFSRQAMNMKILLPNRFSELKLDKISWEAFASTANIHKDLIAEKFDRWARLKIAFPDENEKYDDFSPEVWERMKAILENYRKDQDWQNFPTIAINMKIIHPDKNAELNLNEEIWQGMKHQTELSQRAKHWAEFSGWAYKIKIIFPGKIKELNLNDETWAGMKKYLDGCRRDDEFFYFAEQAAKMKILAAEQVKITEKGLEINMHKERKGGYETPQMPETKKY